MATAAVPEEPQGLQSHSGNSAEAGKEIPGISSAPVVKKTIGHRGVDQTGETMYKKTPSWALQGAIQLGITHTVCSLAQKSERDVLLQDFEEVESIYFPGAGSSHTPAHHYGDFGFKTYAPIAFRYFREMFCIQPDDYMCSLCSEDLIELSNPGASGSLFYLSNDDQFIMKTVQRKEAEFLQKLLPGYFMNLNQNKRTLLPKFYGLYCIQANGTNIRVVVMNNLLPSSVQLHLKFDLKGSTYNRRASSKERAKPLPTFKDLDFLQDMPDGMLLDADMYSAFCKTVQRDCLVLQSFKIMDYSLLLGIHVMDQAGGETVQTEQAAERRKPQNQKFLYSTPMEAIQAEASGTGSSGSHDPTGGIPARNSKGQRLLIYIGLIDILQSYRFIKRLEHTWKSLVQDADTVSVHRPDFYADRFQKFMCNTVFKRVQLKTSPSKRRHSTLRKSDSAAAQPAEQSSSQSQNPNQQLIGKDENQQPVVEDEKSSAGKEDTGQDSAVMETPKSNEGNGKT